MERVRELFRKFQNSDGRIKALTATSVLALAAVVALAVGVLPALGSSPGQSGEEEIKPVVVNYGGGSGACADPLDGRGPSAAGFELHINNPATGDYPVTGPGGTTYTFHLDVDANDEYFDFNLVGPAGVEVYDVIVNGGSQNTHYDYDDHPDADGDLAPGTVTFDTHLHAPPKGPNKVFKLSHINICFDEPGQVILICDTAKTIFSTGTFPEATALVLEVEDEFGNPVEPCLKDGIFTINVDPSGPDSVTLDFGTGGGTVTGRLDIHKDFGSPPYADLRYDGGPSGDDAVPWCGIDTITATAHDFTPELAHTEYPTLPAGHTACKVYEGENAAGDQHNVMYFEFEDPNFY